MSNGIIDSLLSKAQDYILEKEGTTVLKSGFSGIDDSNYSLALARPSNYGVAEITPNRSKLSQSYLISGTDATLALQESMLIAIHDIVQDITGTSNNIDITDWINQFELGFPNFQIKTDLFSDPQYPWGLLYQDRPLLRLLSPIKDVKNTTYFTLQLYPSRTNTSETYLISGDTSSCITQAMTIMAQSQLMRDNSVGQWVGYPIEEDYRRYNRNYFAIKFLFSTKQQPPFKKRNEYKSTSKVINKSNNRYTSPSNEFSPFRRVQLTLPLVGGTALSYQNIRKACGGDGGLQIGYWGAKIPIGLPSLNGQTFFFVRGVDYESSLQNAQGFLKLLDEKVTTGNATPVYLDQCYQADLLDGYDSILNEYTVYPNNIVLYSNTKTQRTNVSTDAKAKAIVKHCSSKYLPIWQEIEPPGFTAGLETFLAKLNN